MELRHLRYFIAVAQELHFGRAAQRLHISQPPLSQQIRELEQELGVRLFTRTSRRVGLTRAGSAFYQEAERIFSQVQRAVDIARAVGRGEAGALGVGFCAPAMDGPLPFALKAYGRRYPDVRLELREARTPELLTALRLEQIDVGFVRLFGERPEGLESVLFFQEPYKLAVPAGHRLCTQEKATLRDLDGESLLMVPRQDYRTLYDAFFMAFGKAGARVRIVREVAGKQTMAALTVAGAGVCFLPASMQQHGRAGLHFLDVTDAIPVVEIFMAWKTGSAAALVRTFVAEIHKYHGDSQL